MRCKFNIIMDKRQKYDKQVALFFAAAMALKENCNEKNVAPRTFVTPGSINKQNCTIFAITKTDR